MPRVTRELPVEDDSAATPSDAEIPPGGLPIQGGLSEGTMRQAGFGGGVLPGMDEDISINTIVEHGVETADGGDASHPVHDADEENATPETFESQMDDIEAAARQAGNDYAELLEREVEDPRSLETNRAGPAPDIDRTTIDRDQDERP